MPRTYFISGTDTNVGKTIVSAILVNKFDALYYKPIQCGYNEKGEKDSDIVIVAIGENQGANIMATAAVKNLNAKRLITRSVNPLQENVLLAMGLDEIINPEVESADRLAKKLCLTGLVDSFELDKDYSIVEIETPSKYINKTLEEINFRKVHNLVILTTIKKMNKSLLGISIKKKYVNGVATPSTTLNKEDILVIYGHNKDIKKMLNS